MINRSLINMGNLTLTNIWGTRGNDTLYCEANSVVLGLAGDDILYTKPLGSSANQVLMGGFGNDTYYTGSNSKSFILDAGGANDILHNNVNFSNNIQFRTIDGKHFIMSDPTNNWEVVIPNVYTSGVDVVRFASGESFNFWDFSKKYIQNGPQISSTGNSSTAAFVAACDDVAFAYQSPRYTGYFSDKDQGAVQFFDSNAYLANKAAAAKTDVATIEKAIADAGMRPIKHFQLFGAFEADGKGKIGINPSSLFDVNNYYEQKVQLDHKNGGNSTVEGMAKAFQAGGFDPVTHYITFGRAEGLKPQPVVTTVGLDADLHDIVGEGA